MSRWTKQQKEMQGYRRKLAYGQQKISLVEEPWKKEEVGREKQTHTIKDTREERTKKTR